jgi:hypothetical protein
MVIAFAFGPLLEVYRDHEVGQRRSVVYAIRVGHLSTRRGLAQRRGGERHWAFSFPDFSLGVCGVAPEASVAFE